MLLSFNKKKRPNVYYRVAQVLSILSPIPRLSLTIRKQGIILADFIFSLEDGIKSKLFFSIAAL